MFSKHKKANLETYEKMRFYAALVLKNLESDDGVNQCTNLKSQSLVNAWTTHVKNDFRSILDDFAGVAVVIPFRQFMPIKSYSDHFFIHIPLIFYQVVCTW